MVLIVRDAITSPEGCWIREGAGPAKEPLPAPSGWISCTGPLVNNKISGWNFKEKQGICIVLKHPSKKLLIIVLVLKMTTNSFIAHPLLLASVWLVTDREMGTAVEKQTAPQPCNQCSYHVTQGTMWQLGHCLCGILPLTPQTSVYLWENCKQTQIQAIIQNT